jgi:hypothetical protein
VAAARSTSPANRPLSAAADGGLATEAVLTMAHVPGIMRDDGGSSAFNRNKIAAIRGL